TVGEQLDDRRELNVGDAQGDRGRRDDQAHHDATDEGNGHSDSGRLLGGRIPRPPTRLSDTHPVCLRTTETWTCPTIDRAPPNRVIMRMDGARMGWTVSRITRAEEAASVPRCRLDRVDLLGGVVLLILGLLDEEREDDSDQGDDRGQQEGGPRSRRTGLRDRPAACPECRAAE